MIEDSTLLRRYVDDRSEAAFAELVRRRVNLVYAVALRQVAGDTQLAEDVTQKVFVDLARKARALADRPVLSGWLYRSAQFAASDIVRSERRRRSREQETFAMNETSANFGDGPDDWDKLRPVLDELMQELSDEDRDAVALRYFEGRPFAEIGARLSLAEDSARKRVERALDKLHSALARRGVTSTTAALGLALANQVAAAAPAGLAATVTGAALAGTGTGAGVGAGAAILHFMSTTKFLLGTAGAVAVLAAVYETNRAAQAQTALGEATQQAAAAHAKLQATENHLQAETKRAAAAEADNGKLLAAIEALQRATASKAGTPPARQVMGATAEAGAAGGEITHATVDARYKHAQELARNGAWADALAEFLWCYDEGMVRVSSYVGVRSSFLLLQLSRLGENYPPALDALRERRDRAEQRMMADSTGRGAASDVASLNGALGDSARNVELYDQFPAGDARKRAMGYEVFEPLLEVQRYSDAVVALPYSQMTMQFDRIIEERPLPAGIRNPEMIRRSQRENAVGTASTNIEALAGAGDLANAKTLMGRLLAYDSSDTTKATLREHLTRAGHPELLAP